MLLKVRVGKNWSGEKQRYNEPGQRLQFPKHPCLNISPEICSQGPEEQLSLCAKGKDVHPALLQLGTGVYYRMREENGKERHHGRDAS